MGTVGNPDRQCTSIRANRHPAHVHCNGHDWRRQTASHNSCSQFGIQANDHLCAGCPLYLVTYCGVNRPLQRGTIPHHMPLQAAEGWCGPMAHTQDLGGQRSPSTTNTQMALAR